MQKMINFDDVTKGNMKEHNSNWLENPDHSYRILVIGGSRSGKTSSFCNIISHQSEIEKNYFYAEDPYKAKYQLLIIKQEM